MGLAAGASVASGIRVYATVAALGFLHRIGAIHLPHGLEVLSEVPIIVLASALYLIEFVADKVPAVDSVWDAVHTFIRPPAAAVLGFAAFGDVAEPWRIAAALLCGTLALSSHGIKASTRLAINTSPEPFTNWAASFGEDVFVAALIWAAVSHPAAALVVAGVVLIAAALLATWIYRMLRRLFRPLSRSRAESSHPPRS
ncbi:MAG TPA: DUF4126 domain-containing protein [Thermoanaerobaculia bacterium]|nr:DUF4126 domain-containing protein [Thermoanaerobaculia bacterium]